MDDTDITIISHFTNDKTECSGSTPEVNNPTHWWQKQDLEIFPSLEGDQLFQFIQGCLGFSSEHIMSGKLEFSGTSKTAGHPSRGLVEAIQRT